MAQNRDPIDSCYDKVDEATGIISLCQESQSYVTNQELDPIMPDFFPLSLLWEPRSFWGFHKQLYVNILAATYSTAG